MTDLLSWPTTLLVPASVKLALGSSSRGGGQTVDGNEAVVASPASQRWTLTLGGVVIRTAEQVRAWRALEAQLDGRANPILVPVYDGARSPVAAAMAGGIEIDDAAPFLPDAASISVAQAAAVNAVDLALSWSGPAPLPGQNFCAGGRLYRIAALTATGAGAATARIRPWLREPIPANTALNFDAPVCAMRLAKDDGMSLDLQLWRFASPSVDFVEYF